MALTLQQIRDYVREHLDVEQDDLSDVLLDSFIREGSRRIERAEARWPFFEASYSLTLAAAANSVAKTTVAAALDQVTNIAHTGAYPPLKWIGPDAYQELMAQQSSATGRPTYWTEWAGNLVFFPTADIEYTMTVYAYRKATDWVALGAGQTPDLPEELHNTVAVWALSKAYAQQEDPELASLYERQFADELNEFRRRLVVTPHNQPLVLNGGSLRDANTLLVRPRYDWEV